MRATGHTHFQPDIGQTPQVAVVAALEAGRLLLVDAGRFVLSGALRCGG